MNLVTLLVFLFFVGGSVFYVITLYNGLIGVRADIEKAWSNIDVLLKQRYDEIPRLVEVCKGYMHYERETLEAVTQARSRYAQAETVAQKADASGKVTSSVQQLLVAAENYPNLKASETFLELRNRITQLESEIADRREFYNDAVNHYNVRIQQMPDAMLAQMMGLQPRTMFHALSSERIAAAVLVPGGWSGGTPGR
ncbi:MAG: LemA family protein [Acidobacteria bacterium]|nr:MAG: LemA family protein [Acidobacteriota bacterium]